MIREEYSIRLIRWWSIAEKSRRAAFVKKDGERNVSWVHWNGNTLAICRNTGKSFHRFPSSIRSEWHRNPVGLTPFSPDRTCLSLSLHSNGAEKHTREKGWQSFRGKFSSKWNIPLSLSILQSYPVGGIDISLPRSFLCTKFESWWQISFRKVFSKTEKSARILCKLNDVPRHALHKHSARGINDSQHAQHFCWMRSWADQSANYRNNLIGQQLRNENVCPWMRKWRNVYWN